MRPARIAPGACYLRAKRSVRITWFAVGLAMIAFSVPNHADAHEVPLWTRTGDPCPVDTLSKQAHSCISVKVSAAALQMTNVELRLELPNGTSIKATHVDSRHVNQQAFIWHGTVHGAASSSVTFSAVNDTVVGAITINGAMYRLRSVVGDKQVVEQLDPGTFLDGGQPPDDPGPSPPPDDDDPSQSACGTDDPTRIDVMVLYTAAAQVAAGGIESMSAWIFLQLYLTDLSYLNSEVAQQLNLVYHGVTDYSEESTSADLLKLTSQTDEDLKDVHSLRNQYNADAVILVSHSSGLDACTQANALRPGDCTSGLAHQMRSTHVDNMSFEPFAFGVIDVAAFLTSEYTFGHELGHVMGAQHDYPSSDGAIIGSSHGYEDETPSLGCKRWTTIMTQRSSCEICNPDDPTSCIPCERAPYWSSSDQSILNCGERVGEQIKDNSRTLNRTAATVSRFRCGTSTPHEVWMKDDWADTGAEPDPGLALKEMWKSPYVWIRNSRDPGPEFPAQHQHENPEANRTNYAYAKIHNNGESTSGLVQLWAAKAATGLSWPLDFSPVNPDPASDRIILTDFASNTTRIVEFPWIPPDTGHYCLVARWHSESDPATGETQDIGANVRASNNLVWRNVNVIGLAPGIDAASADLIVRNVEDNPAELVLHIRPSDRNPRRSFMKIGKVTLTLDRDLMRAWSSRDREDAGFRPNRIGSGNVDPEGATLKRLKLGPRQEAQIRLTFERLDGDDRNLGTFQIDVIQSQLAHGELRVVGGVTYEIKTGPVQ